MRTPQNPQIDVRRADDRFKTEIGWLDSKHSFSFGHHNTHHGLLLVNNDDTVTPGAGPLGTGDAVRFTAVGGQRVTATKPAEILVWEMHATIAA